ncbi:MAG: FAD-dependent oxidoreductase [Phycisphaerae bacterium]
MSSIQYRKDQSIPVIASPEVAVIGGGPGGIGAAVFAARAGARTLLIERYGYLGGMAAAGEVHPFMPNHAGGKCLDKPVYVEWVQAMRGYMPQGYNQPVDGEIPDGNARVISKDAAMLAAEDLCLSAGAELLYHHSLADVIASDGKIEAIVLLSKSGLTAVTAECFVDATGDADLAAWAGCPIEVGGPSGHCQPMTLCFKLGGVDKSRTPGRREVTELYHQAREAGQIDCVREDVLQFEWVLDDVVHFNTTRVIHKSGISGAELSAAEIDARRQLREYLQFFRNHVPGYEKAYVFSVAHHVGVRETRRVKGKAYLVKQDFVDASKFDDAIARVHYPIDIHNPDGQGTEHLRLEADEYYEIPYGCIVPEACDNLLIAGRPISVDHAVHSSMRVMPPAMSVGQAAGLAAATAAKSHNKPADLDGRQIRATLQEMGAYL